MMIMFLTSLTMNPETAVNFTRGRFNKVVFAVIYIYRGLLLVYRYLNVDNG